MKSFAPKKGLSDRQIASLVDAILEEATLAEKVGMMSGRGFFKAMLDSGGDWGDRPYRAGGGIERLGVPALWFTDGPRGVTRGSGENGSTCFPCTMARGATWDRELERRIGEIMGREARAQGCNLSGAVCVNLLRHPGWGRAQETYGEDPYHLGELGNALAQGIQIHNVIATVKHFALNSIENSRFKVDVRIGERALREVYLPHFKTIIDGGCASVMSAYNKMNGEYCGQNRRLLTEILRSEWGFEGFVHSDWMMGVYAVYGAAAGLDIENPEPLQFGENLCAAVERGDIAPDVVDTACRRILQTIYHFACAEDPVPDYSSADLASASNIAVAREAAEKSAVLLTNDGTLPLAKETRIGVFGKLAAIENTGDNGSSKVCPPYVVTPLQGIAAFLGQDAMSLSGDESDPDAAAAAAAKLDVPIIVVGTTAEEEGEYIPGDIGMTAFTLPNAKLPPEMAAFMAAGKDSKAQSGAMGGVKDRGGDRANLRLSPDQIALIEAVSRVNARTVVVLVSGSGVICDWSDRCSAVMQTLYSGMEGGTALARLLFGAANPSGKLPFTIAMNEDDYPPFDFIAEKVEYGQFHGYTLLEKTETAPRFPFGHGLSYTQFEYRALKVRRTNQGAKAQVTIRNSGHCAGAEIAQLYVGFPGQVIERPKKLLRGFERVKLEPGEQRTINFQIAKQALCYWNEDTSGWHLEPGEHKIAVGGSSAPEKLIEKTILI